MGTAPPSWTCAFCGRTVPGRVDECYCGRTRPAARPPAPRARRRRRSWIPALVVFLAVATSTVWYVVSRRESSPPATSVATKEIARPLPLAATTDAALTAPVSDDIVNTSHAAIVMVESTERRGTGFFSAMNEITTTTAIVGRQRSVTVTLPDGRQIEATVTARADQPGLALLTTATASTSWLAAAPVRDARSGEGLVALPWAQEAARGRVTGLRLEHGVEAFETSLILHADDEGAPLVDRTGRVLGVVAGRRAVSHEAARAYFRAAP